MRSIRKIARASNNSKINAQIKIKQENTKWNIDEIDNKYVSKTYYLETNTKDNQNATHNKKSTY